MNLKDVFNKNKDKIIEVSEQNTTRNKDGLTVIKEDELTQSEAFMNIRNKFQDQMKKKGFGYNKDLQTVEKEETIEEDK